ncbi:MAG: amino acid adenylation domain-containing protein, partial [Legionella sp.]|uniref:amino acid adenylation domain-containing protein n=1 Tax=Legionella sp. TaxID=459 RepID=UPI0028484AAB|nr:amino acid adenylation domain-containing protein [Legionella sp.]
MESEAHELPTDTLIAIFLDRSLDMIIAILGILKAGAAYVPIDLKCPTEKIRSILKDINTQVVVTQTHLTSALSSLFHEDPRREINVQFVAIDDKLYRFYDRANTACYSRSTDLCYVMYTSGTTGVQKGVMVEHRSVTNMLFELCNTYQITPYSKVTAYTAYVFDVSVFEIFVTLLQGAELHVLSEYARKDIQILSSYLKKNNITHMYLPPAILAVLPRKKFSHLGYIIFAGEPCEKETGLYWSNSYKLYNYYGPTEAAIFATGQLVSSDNLNVIGKPVQNTKIYVLDICCKPVPIGVVGELYIGGAGLARGYLNNPGLNESKFISNPFATVSDSAKSYTRLYRTGDLVRWLSDGSLEYIGRKDNQIKLRGYRIEPGEIEHAKSSYDG